MAMTPPQISFKNAINKRICTDYGRPSHQVGWGEALACVIKRIQLYWNYKLTLLIYKIINQHKNIVKKLWSSNRNCGWRSFLAQINQLDFIKTFFFLMWNWGCDLKEWWWLGEGWWKEKDRVGFEFVWWRLVVKIRMDFMWWWLRVTRISCQPPSRYYEVFDSS